MANRRPDRTLGPGHDTFWEWCGKGELRLQRCGDCARFSWPVTERCEHCGGANLSWERMSGRGTIVSWSTFERDYYRGTIPIPYDNILVELEEGPLFLSNPKDLARHELSSGLPVKLDFLECEDRAGRFALPVFGKI